MKVSQLIAKLQKMPQDTEVEHIWAGEKATWISTAWTLLVSLQETLGHGPSDRAWEDMADLVNSFMKSYIPSVRHEKPTS